MIAMIMIKSRAKQTDYDNTSMRCFAKDIYLQILTFHGIV